VPPLQQLDRDEDLPEEDNGTMEVLLFQKMEDRDIDGTPLDIREVVVFEDCSNSVDAFRLCVVEGIGHGFGVVWQGINPAQVRSACEMLHFPQEEWSDISRDVSYMGDVVADSRNKRQEQEANRRR
jgi:hypothetical protein